METRSRWKKKPFSDTNDNEFQTLNMMHKIKEASKRRKRRSYNYRRIKPIDEPLLEPLGDRGDPNYIVFNGTWKDASGNVIQGEFNKTNGAYYVIDASGNKSLYRGPSENEIPLTPDFWEGLDNDTGGIGTEDPRDVLLKFINKAEEDIKFFNTVVAQMVVDVLSKSNFAFPVICTTDQSSNIITTTTYVDISGNDLAKGVFVICSAFPQGTVVLDRYYDASGNMMDDLLNEVNQGINKAEAQLFNNNTSTSTSTSTTTPQPKTTVLKKNQMRLSNPATSSGPALVFFIEHLNNVHDVYLIQKYISYFESVLLAWFVTYNLIYAIDETSFDTIPREFDRFTESLKKNKLFGGIATFLSYILMLLAAPVEYPLYLAFAFLITLMNGLPLLFNAVGFLNKSIIMLGIFVALFFFNENATTFFAQFFRNALYNDTSDNLVAIIYLICVILWLTNFFKRLFDFPGIITFVVLIIQGVFMMLFGASFVVAFLSIILIVLSSSTIWHPLIWEPFIAPMFKASQPQAESDSMTQAQAESTPTAQAESTPTAQAESTPTAQAESTPTAQAESTPTAQAESTPTAQAESTPTAQATAPAQEGGMGAFRSIAKAVGPVKELAKLALNVGTKMYEKDRRHHTDKKKYKVEVKVRTCIDEYSDKIKKDYDEEIDEHIKKWWPLYPFLHLYYMFDKINKSTESSIIGKAICNIPELKAIFQSHYEVQVDVPIPTAPAAAPETAPETAPAAAPAAAPETATATAPETATATAPETATATATATATKGGSTARFFENVKNAAKNAAANFNIDPTRKPAPIERMMKRTPLADLRKKGSEYFNDVKTTISDKKPTEEPKKAILMNIIYFFGDCFFNIISKFIIELSLLIIIIISYTDYADPNNGIVDNDLKSALYILNSVVIVLLLSLFVTRCYGNKKFILSIAESFNILLGVGVLSWGHNKSDKEGFFSVAGSWFKWMFELFISTGMLIISLPINIVRLIYNNPLSWPLGFVSIPLTYLAEFLQLTFVGIGRMLLFLIKMVVYLVIFALYVPVYLFLIIFKWILGIVAGSAAAAFTVPVLTVDWVIRFVENMFSTWGTAGSTGNPEKL